MVALRNYPAAEQAAEPEQLGPMGSPDEPLTLAGGWRAFAVLASVAIVQLVWVGFLGYAGWLIFGE